MDIRELEELLGVKYTDSKERVTLRRDGWQRLKEQVDPDGTTLLLKAARDGARECVDLLLRCGVDVNALHEIKKELPSVSEWMRAIDYSLDHPQVALLLFQWDSVLPNFNITGNREKFKSLIKDGEEIRKTFTERKDFHEKAKNGDTESLEEILELWEYTSNGRRYWLDEEGHTALYSVANAFNFDTWAFLRSKNFDYLNEEKEDVEGIHEYKALEFNLAMGRHFVEVNGWHIHKMMTRTKVRGATGDMRRKVQRIYEDIDKVPMTSLLLQCLQDEPNFDVILDVEKSNISCMRDSLKGDLRLDGILGLTDPGMDRVYASAGETEDFKYSDVVSNLVHELSHKVMYVLYDNGGLPYRNSEEKKKIEYNAVVATILSDNRIEKCDTIIQRIKDYNKELQPKELIVRVPEIVSKYYSVANQGMGMEILKSQAMELLEYYSRHVEPEMENHIEKNGRRNKMPTGDLLKFPNLLCDHKREDTEVREDMKEVVTQEHNGVSFIQVSNLKLGVSHLKNSFDGLDCVDWSTYFKCDRYFETRMRKGYIKNLGVVLHGCTMKKFCENPWSCENTCPAKRFVKHKNSVTLLIPKDFTVPNGILPVDYVWNDLSSKTKERILSKKVNFQGRAMPLRELFKSAVGEGTEESKIASFLNADVISFLIDQEDVAIGRPVETALVERGHDLLREHPECVISRRKILRTLALNRKLFISRESDAFFICNTRESDVRKEGFDEFCHWDGEKVQTGIRCFLLKRRLHRAHDGTPFKEIIMKLKRLPCKDLNGEREWICAHFFKYKHNKFVHLHSEYVKSDRVVILADVPGSGKSVFVNSEALREKDESPMKWIEVVELTNHEMVIGKWKNFTSKENAQESLFQLISAGGEKKVGKRNLSLNKMIFNQFCQVDEKVLIFFDGFDELGSDNVEKFTTFLEAVVKGTKARFWVTTRTHERATLEERLTSVAYKLVPFDKEEQVRYLNSQWNSSLGSLPSVERAEKIKLFISNLRSSYDLNKEEKLSAFTENLNLLLCEEENEPFAGDVNFEGVAEKQMEFGKSSVSEEGDFSELPLHTWMLATVSFEDNFAFSGTLSIPKLYRRFVGMKIDLFVEEKAKATVGGTVETQRRSHVKTTYDSLKKFSAWFFLGYSKHELDEDDKKDMLKVGLVTERENSHVFIHRTFGEYIFSIWLLEKAKSREVTKIWLSEVLLKAKYRRVRQVIDGLLRSDYEESSIGGGGKPVWIKCLLNTPTFPAKTLQKCTCQAVLECHAGIINYLADSSETSLAEVIFGKADWNIKLLKIKTLNQCKTSVWNAFVLCGECIQGGVEMKNYLCPPSRIEYLKFLSSLLQLMEMKTLIENINEIIAAKGLQLMGVNRSELWNEEEGKNIFKLILEFLLRNKAELGITVRNELLSTKSEFLFSNASVYSFEPFVRLLDTILNGYDFSNLLVPSFWRRLILTKNTNLVCAWTSVVKYSGVEDVKRFWAYLRGKLVTRESRRTFLLREDRMGRHGFYAALFNWEDTNVISHVWELFRTEFGDGEINTTLLDTFKEVDYSHGINLHGIFQWLLGLMDGDHLDDDEATRLLLSTDKNGDHYLLSFKSLEFPSPKTFYNLQDLLLSGRLGRADVLKHIEGQYECLAPSCFSPSGWIGVDDDFIAIVRSEYDKFSRRLLIKLILHGLQIDQDGCWSHMLNAEGERIVVDRVKAYLVMLRRQLMLEVEILGKEEVLSRLRNDLYWMFMALPVLHLEGVDEEHKNAGAILFNFIFDVISEFLTEKQLNELMECAFHNRGAFQRAYAGWYSASE